MADPKESITPATEEPPPLCTCEGATADEPVLMGPDCLRYGCYRSERADPLTLVRALLPLAESRLEDMEEAAEVARHEQDDVARENLAKARAAVTAAKKALGLDL